MVHKKTARKCGFFVVLIAPLVLFQGFKVLKVSGFQGFEGFKGSFKRTSVSPSRRLVCFLKVTYIYTYTYG